MVTQFEQKLVDGMIAKGISRICKTVFRQLEGFGSYGFPESHAASFALLVYVLPGLNVIILMYLLRFTK